MYYQSTARYKDSVRQRRDRIEISLLQVIMAAFTVVLGFVLPVNLYEYYKYEQAHPALYTEQAGQVAGLSTDSITGLLDNKDSLMAIGLAMIIGALLITFYLLVNLINSPAPKTKPKVNLDEYNFA